MNLHRNKGPFRFELSSDGGRAAAFRVPLYTRPAPWAAHSHSIRSSNRINCFGRHTGKMTGIKTLPTVQFYGREAAGRHSFRGPIFLALITHWGQQKRLARTRIRSELAFGICGLSFTLQEVETKMLFDFLPQNSELYSGAPSFEQH